MASTLLKHSIKLRIQFEREGYGERPVGEDSHTKKMFDKKNLDDPPGWSHQGISCFINKTEILIFPEDKTLKLERCVKTSCYSHLFWRLFFSSTFTFPTIPNKTQLLFLQKF